MAAGSFLSCRGQNLPIHQLGLLVDKFSRTRVMHPLCFLSPEGHFVIFIHSLVVCFLLLDSVTYT